MTAYTAVNAARGAEFAGCAALTAQQEASEAQPWALSDAPDSYIDVMLRGIVGFRFAITRLEGKWKMSQNREAEDRKGVVAGLQPRASGEDREIADAVARGGENRGA